MPALVVALSLALAAGDAPAAGPAAAAPSAAATGAAAPTAAPPGSPAASPAAAVTDDRVVRGDPRALMARELPALERRRFETAAGISGEVEAAAPVEPQPGDGVEGLAVQLGTGEPMSCSLLARRLDVGETLRAILESLKGRVELVGVQPTEIVAVEGNALVLFVVVYRAASERGPLVGLLKLGMYVDGAHSAVCLHDEPGYTATFARVVKGLAGSLRGGGEDPLADATYRELNVVTFETVPIGFTEHAAWKRGGGRTTELRSTRFLPRSATDVVITDRTEREESDSNDLLVQGLYLKTENGEVDTALRVGRRQDGRTYAYEGERDGKKLEGTFRAKGGLATDAWFARRLAGPAPVPSKPVSHALYSYEANPVAPVEAAYHAVPGAPRRAIMNIGSLRIEGDLDAHGFMTRAEIPAGAGKVVLKQVYARGTP